MAIRAHENRRRTSALTSRTTSFEPLLEDFLGFSEDPAEELLAAAAAGEDAAAASCVTVGRTGQGNKEGRRGFHNGVRV